MKNASKAMKNIHGGLTIEKVDETMEQLREQHAVGEEIAEALTQGSLSTGVDEEELEDELAELQQEELDNKMLKTGTVPVGDRVDRLPVAREYSLVTFQCRALANNSAATRRVEEEDEEEELKKLQAEMAI